MTAKKNTHWEPKSKGAGFFVFFILIVAGVCVGLLLQKLIAPDSKAANVISVAMLPASVVIGAIAWQVIIIIFIFIKIGRSTLKGFKKGGVKAALNQKVEGFPPFPPGTFVFVLVSSVICLISGVVIAFMPDVKRFFSTVVLYFITGVIYGYIQRYLVRAGYIVIFESDEPSTEDQKEKINI